MKEKNKKTNGRKKKKDNNSNWLPIGMCLGIALSGDDDDEKE